MSARATPRVVRCGDRARRVITGGLGVVLWVLTWQWFTASGPLSDVVGIPTASDTGRAAVSLASDEDFWSAVGTSLWTAVIALSIALVVGVALGIVLGLSRAVESAVDPTTQFLRPVPPVVLLPLVLLIVGPTVELAVIIAAIGALWPILVQVQVGIRDVDPVAIDTARSMSLSWWRTQASVVLPSALPYVATGVRIAASLSLMLAIGAGILGGSPGLGQAISVAQETGEAERVFGMLLWAGLLGVVLNVGLAVAEGRLTRGRGPEVLA